MIDISSLLTAVATVLLSIIGIFQLIFLLSQRSQLRRDWTETYRSRWLNIRPHWKVVVYCGRDEGEYYQIANNRELKEYSNFVSNSNYFEPSIWALDASRNVCGLLSDITQKILKGTLHIDEIYPIFGTELLRHSISLRRLLEVNYRNGDYGSLGPNNQQKTHDKIRKEIQTWLVCHDGIRRRCLILIDMLWAEAVRLEDLPPDDIRKGANAKKLTSAICKKRLYQETLRLGGRKSLVRAFILSRFLQHSEYKKNRYSYGVTEERLNILEESWNNRYLA